MNEQDEYYLKRAVDQTWTIDEGIKLLEMLRDKRGWTHIVGTREHFEDGDFDQMHYVQLRGLR